MIDSENFKSTFAVFKELSYEWKNLSDIQKAEITQILGGVQRSQAVSALIKKFGDAEEAVVRFSESSGSALAKNEIMLDTVAKKAERFGAQFEKTADSLIDSGLIKNFLDFGRILLQILDAGNGIPAKIITIVSLTSAVGAFVKTSSGMQIKNFFASFITGIKEYLLYIPRVITSTYAYQTSLAATTTSAGIATTKLQIFGATVKGVTQD